MSVAVPHFGGAKTRRQTLLKKLLGTARDVSLALGWRG
jgi:hypothetical protein